MPLQRRRCTRKEDATCPRGGGALPWSVLRREVQFRFECQRGCVACCSVKGYIYLTEADLRRAAAFLGMTARAFEKKYVYRTRHLLRLRKPPEAQCHFLTEQGCAIHPVKPAQCRAFPFWPESVASPRAWRELRRYCPGIGKGDIVPLEAVQRIANEMREAYPGMYPVKNGGS